MADPLRASSDLENLPVYDADQLPVGRTYGVLSEAESGLVRYFDVALDTGTRHVLVPVGHARLERALGFDRLRLRAAAAPELERIPTYEPHVPWSDDTFQQELLTAFGRLFQGERYYAHPAYDHDGLYCGTNPILREPLAPAGPAGLQRLSRLSGYRVAEGEPDVHDWAVVAPDGSPTGRVTDLIIDTAAGQVRYLVAMRGSDGAEVAVPIGYAELAVNDAAVNLPFTAADLGQLPQLRGSLERDEEAELRLALDAVLEGKRRFERPDFRWAA